MTELDTIQEKSRRRFNIATACFVVVLLCTGLAIAAAIVSVQRFNEQRTLDKEQSIELDFQACLRANDSREGLRDTVNEIADQQSVIGDVSVIPDADAPELSASLRLLFDASQKSRKAKADAFRERNLKKFAPRDCNAERKAAGG